MTTPQGPVPPPPHGEASWLDAACRGMVAYSGNPITDYARAELAALRKELSDVKAERDERTMRYWSAAEERDALRAQVAELNEMGDATAKRLSEMLTNRTHQLNEARAQVQELREAALKLGTLTHNPKVYPSCDDGYDYPVQAVLSRYRLADWNAHVAKLSPEPAPKEQQGKAGR